MLLAQLWRIIEPIPVKPVLTLIIIGVNIYIHIFGNVPFPVLGYYNIGNIRQHCLHPRHILEDVSTWSSGLVYQPTPSTWLPQWLARHKAGFPWNRLIFPAFIHGDDMHLYYNMISYIYKGILLEPEMGFAKYAMLQVFAVLVPHFLVIGISFILDTYTTLPNSYSNCTVGFSAAIFAMKYLVNQKGIHGDAGAMTTSTNTTIRGIHFPTRHVAWLELVLIYILVPNSSFVGHMCGILSGMIWVHGNNIYSNVQNYLKLILTRDHDVNRRIYIRELNHH